MWLWEKRSCNLYSTEVHICLTEVGTSAHGSPMSHCTGTITVETELHLPVAVFHRVANRAVTSISFLTCCKFLKYTLTVFHLQKWWKGTEGSCSTSSLCAENGKTAWGKRVERPQACFKLQKLLCGRPVHARYPCVTTQVITQ